MVVVHFPIAANFSLTMQTALVGLLGTTHPLAPPLSQPPYHNADKTRFAILPDGPPVLCAGEVRLICD